MRAKLHAFLASSFVKRLHSSFKMKLQRFAIASPLHNYLQFTSLPLSLSLSTITLLSMGRPPCCDKSNVKRGLWTAEEDAKILAHISNYGIGNWTLVPMKAGLNRCGKSCRLRWTNYLKPDLKHDSFTPQEEELIINFHKVVGSRWSLIAKQIPGRTDNDVKNYWNTKLRKKLSKMGIDPVTHKPFSQILSDYGNISGLQNSTGSHGSLNRNINYTAIMSSKPEPSSVLTGSFPNTDTIRIRPKAEQFQDSILNDQNIASWDYFPSHQFHFMNQETIQPQTLILSEATSSCSSSSSNVTQLSSPQPYSQAQILPSSSFNWNEFLLTDPLPFPEFQQHQDRHFPAGVIMSSTNSSSSFASENQINKPEGGLESAFDFGGQLTNQRSEASSSMSSFVDDILDKDSEMRAEFPDILDGSFDFY